MKKYCLLVITAFAFLQASSQNVTLDWMKQLGAAGDADERLHGASRRGCRGREDASGSRQNKDGGGEGCSFLKKRTKKLLGPWLGTCRQRDSWCPALKRLGGVG